MSLSQDHNLVFGDVTYERELSRPYPVAVGGDNVAFTFDPDDAMFNLSYTIGDTSQVSDIYIGKSFYPDGFDVFVRPSSCCNVTAEENGIVRVAHVDVEAGELVSISAVPKEA